MTKLVKPVSEMYFGHKIGNTQDPDEPYDPIQAKKDSLMEPHMQGRGSQGSGSKRTPQAFRRRSQATSGSSAPKRSQKLRG